MTRRTKQWWWMAGLSFYSVLFILAVDWRVECLFLFLMTGALFGPAQSWRKPVSVGSAAFVAICFALFAYNAVSGGGVMTELGKDVRSWFASIDLLVLVPIVMVVWLAGVLAGYHAFRSDAAA